MRAYSLLLQSEWAELHPSGGTQFKKEILLRVDASELDNFIRTVKLLLDQVRKIPKESQENKGTFPNIPPV